MSGRRKIARLWPGTGVFWRIALCADLRPFWTGVLRAQEFGSKQIEGIPSVAVKPELESLLTQVAGLDFGLRIHSDA